MGSITHLAKTITETSEKASWMSTSGNMEMNAAGQVAMQSKDKVVYGAYQPPGNKQQQSNYKLPILLAEHKTHKPGLEQVNRAWRQAADMTFGDMTAAQIRAIHWMFATNIGQSRAQHFDSMRSMAGELFSVGPLEDVVMDMINKFERSEGGEYSNPAIVTAVRVHSSMQRFAGQVHEGLLGALKLYQGDPGKIHVNDEVELIGHPRFNTYGDTFSGGLTFIMNDVWSYTAELTEYNTNKAGNVTFYSGKYRVTLYDHFGLDRPDVEKKFVYLAGFRAWFILQHLNTFACKPFITKVVVEYPFAGNTTMGKTKAERQAIQQRRAAEERRREHEEFERILRESQRPMPGKI